MSVIQFNAHKKYHLLQCKTRVWETHNELTPHYRVIFIRAGEGHFSLDGKLYQYRPQGVILLRPGQHPIFQEDDNAEIFLIAFDTWLADDFLQKKESSPDFADIYKQAEHLCESARLTQGSPLQNERDAQTATYLINQILFEVTQQPTSHNKLIRGSIDLIVTILARNNFETKKVEARQHLAGAIIDYLREELHQNKNIRVPELLMRFNISEDVANLCVLNQTGMSLRNFIFKYKADLFKSRMLKVDISELTGYLQSAGRQAPRLSV
ncbi:hypothetical protein GCM10010967_14720 [Dyadobacter beijingensis]|uniref:Uncharacterized protein n=1 Tax=Dyadobacter beijingensis TaxID=365489 RepID=A0ABQ2HLR0_9BACT|nr:hypothetical protein [Dyadobacter beijingensis]GGM83964.1 hypothetical protein GCM10010967_14720 [Dyadobacter beijingensis]